LFFQPTKSIKMKTLLFALFCAIPFVVSSQNQGNIWYFGDHAGLDFNFNPPVALLDGQTDFHYCCGWNEGSSTISDSTGTLLFYTNGLTIWNALHQPMQNGTNLFGHSSSTESSIIVPKPGSDDLYYVFTADAFENVFFHGFRYSLVDMCLSNGLGAVLADEKNVLLLNSTCEKISAVKHSNDVDYWIITHKRNSDAFHAFLLTNQGITQEVISNTGSEDPQGWGGQMVVSPNRQMIAYNIPTAQSFGRSLLLDFDPATGIVSNEKILAVGGREWGASFSPDNSKLYQSTAGIGHFFQYDLNAGDLQEIIDSKTYIIQNGPDSWRHHQLGPDGNIYISRTMKQYLSRIENPNELYPGCSYVDEAVYLGGALTSFGLPNFITNYDYPDTRVRCLSTGFSTNEKLISKFTISPNPFTESTVFQFDETLNNATLRIFDSMGLEVKNQGNLSGNIINLNRSNLKSGVYSFMIFEELVLKHSGKLIIIQ
jgi:hypothetical protein